ncbi:MAG: hypothetical protein C4527_29185 [Candidatus Omnitrophota bacterium]|nr:MAG: hypothetical protein C4527_29185 [Candidatus Omnitrophota bacterium]
MAHCTDAFGRGWSHMIRLLFQPFRFVFWLKMAILVLLINGFSSSNLFQYRSRDPANFQELDAMADRMLEMLPFVVLMVVLLLMLMIVLAFLASVARVLFYRGVRDGVIYFGRYIREHHSAIVSYFLWNVIFTIVIVIFLFLAGFALVLVSLLLGAWEGDTTGIVIAATLGLGFVFLLLMLAIVYSVLLDSMVLPQMILKNQGIFASWSNAMGMALENLWEFTGYVFIRVALGIGVGILMFIIGIVIGMFSLVFMIPLSGGGEIGMAATILIAIILLPVMFVLSFFLLPIPVFQDAYALAFMAELTGDAAYEPGGKPTPETVRDMPSLSGAPVGSSPMSAFTPSPSGSINFKDIPVCPEDGIRISPLENRKETDFQNSEEDKPDLLTKEPPPVPPDGRR